MTARVMMISSDSHAGLPSGEYFQYLEREYHDDLEDFLAVGKEDQQLRREAGRRSQFSQLMQDDRARRTDYSTDLAKRLVMSEEEGFSGEVIFPDKNFGNAIPFTRSFGGMGDYSQDHHAAALRAYNRWLAERAAPDRQLGLAIVPMLDADYALAQVTTARGMGLRGILPQWDGGDATAPPLYDERFEPVWAACEADGLVVNFHTGQGNPIALAERANVVEMMVGTCEKYFWCRRPLWHLIFGGVLHRHPGLRVGFVETYADWIPRTVAYLDWVWQVHGGEDLRALCPEPPSVYWARHCFVGAHSASLEEARMHEQFPAGTFTYGSDYPHAQSPWGTSVAYLRATLGGTEMPEAELRAILGDSIAEIYGVDAGALASVADRVGPTVEEIRGSPTTDGALDELPAFIKAQVERPPSML